MQYYVVTKIDNSIFLRCLIWKYLDSTWTPIFMVFAHLNLPNFVHPIFVSIAVITDQCQSK